MAITQIIPTNVYQGLVSFAEQEKGALIAEQRMRPIAELAERTVSLAGASRHTARAYRTGIGQFLGYLEEQWADVLPPSAVAVRPFAEATKEGRRTVWVYRPPAGILAKVTPALLLGFERWLIDKGASARTAEMRLYTVKTFLGVALADNVITTNQATELGVKPFRPRRKRDHAPVGRRLSKAEVRNLRTAVNTDTLKGKRDLAVLDLMLYLGLRSEEVTNITLSDFTQDLGRWWLSVHGKGGKPRKLKVHDTPFVSIAHWLDASGRGTLGEDDVPLFCGLRKGSSRLQGGKLNTAAIRELVATYGHKAGMAPQTGANRLSPHDLRRTAARNAYDNGASLLLVQTMLGHASPDTTAHYIGIEDNPDSTAVDFVRY